MSGLILALDLGSTSFKARLYDRSLRSVADCSAPIAYLRGAAGEVEIAPGEAERAVRHVIGGALAGLSRGELSAVALTSQAQTFALVDGSGRPSSPFVSWMDSRATGTARLMAADRAFAEFGRHASFGAPIAGLAVCILAHLAGATRRPFPSEGRLSFLSSWVVERLTGHSVVDDNLAAMSGLYSLELRDWWPAALERSGLEPQRLPRLCPVGSVAARTAATASEWGLPAGLPVLLAGNDQTAGAYASGIHLDGSLLVTLGTAQVAYRVLVGLPPPSPGLFRGPYPGGRAYQAAVDDGGGSLVSWACRVIAGSSGPDEFFALASLSPPGARGLRFAPGLWEGIGPAHGPEELARSILEHMVASVAEVVRRLEPDCRGRRMLLAGGGSRQPLWPELLGRELGATLELTDADPLLGAARLAIEAIDR